MVRLTSTTLSAANTFPTTKDDLPLAGPLSQGNAEDVPLPPFNECLNEDGVTEDLEDYELPAFEDEEVQEPAAEDGDDRATATAKTSYDSWMKLVEHCSDIKVKTLTFVELIPTRHKGHILEGIAKIYAKLRSLGLDVLRVHTDRAREFTSKMVQQWCLERGIVQTCTSGSDWKSNGRAENEVGIVKRHAKVLMKVHGETDESWPLLVKHAGERRLRWQLQQVGFNVPALLAFNTKVLVKRKSWNERYTAWRWDRVEGQIVGPDPWSSLTSGGYCVRLQDGKFLASTDVIVQHPGLQEGEIVRMVVEKSDTPEEAVVDPQPVRRRLRGKQTVPQVAMMELAPNSGENAPDQIPDAENEISMQNHQQYLLQLHQDVTAVLSEECKLIDDMDPLHMHLIPSLSMLAHQKFDLETQLRSLDLEQQQHAEEENFLVTKTIQAEQVYKEWDHWKDAMMSEYRSLVEEKKAVRQMSRQEAKQLAAKDNLKFEELPSKVVFTRKSGGKRKVRACVCGNFEGPATVSTYAGGCDAAQIRCVVRHAALESWSLYGTDIKCAFLNAPRQDKSKIVVMTVPHIYVRLGVASPNEVWVIDSAVYGLTTSPRDWSDHRDRELPEIKWTRSEKPHDFQESRDGQVAEGDGGGRTCPSDRCYWKSPDPDASCTSVQRTWQGSFVAATDQHLWHLQEECLETGEICHRGVMAIYVDDVLLAAEEAVAQQALQAISTVWECSAFERASVEKAITFCGFEIQANEKDQGGGFRLHQQKYEEELVNRWEVKKTALQLNFKLPTPEEEANMERSEDVDAIRQAQACTGALLWLATRTRPEISIAVSTMSRLCTKNPQLTLEIGLKTMEYLRRPSRGMIYADHPGPEYGPRGQLSKARTETTVEAFSDISYASSGGYRSVQGQAYYYAGAPVMWNTNRQPFPTQSTAESELVSLCEALVGGRAVASLVASIRRQDEQQLVRRLWGDNSAAISLANGEGQGSWRTRHLRIRAAILKSALHTNEWDLNHLAGKELVADSFTKVVDGQAFERALQDLCIQSEVKRSFSSSTTSTPDHSQARLAVLIGSSLISTAAASGKVDDDDEMYWMWVSGLILMSVGAIYVANKVIRSGSWMGEDCGVHRAAIQPTLQKLRYHKFECYVDMNKKNQRRCR